MLVLSRRIGEILMIGEEVEVILLSIKGQQARLGITAPKSIQVHREEVYHRIKAAKTNKVRPAYHTKESANESFSA